MTWNESEHPRDELGRFTEKGGGEDEEEQKQEEQEKENGKNKRETQKRQEESNNQHNFDTPFKLNAEYTETRGQTPAEILLGNSTTSKQKKTQSERNKLINQLGDKLSPAQVLYSSIEELRKIAKEKANNLKPSSVINDIKKSDWLKNKTIKQIGENYTANKNLVAKIISGKDTAGMLDIAHGEKMSDKTYLKDATPLKNYNDTSSEDKEYLKNKIQQQFKDYGFNIEDIKGYEFKNNSEPSKRIAQNKDFKEILKNNKDKILKGEEFSGRFQKHGPAGIFNNNDLKNAIGGFDIRNVQFDKDGNLHLKIYDTYDFNKNANDFLNKAGRHEMEAGNLKPFFSIHDIIIPKEEINEILK